MKEHLTNWLIAGGLSLALPGGSTLGFAAGLGIAAGVIEDGHFQSLRAMFHKQGLGPNLMESACYSLGLAWRL